MNRLSLWTANRPNVRVSVDYARARLRVLISQGAITPTAPTTSRRRRYRRAVPEEQ